MTDNAARRVNGRNDNYLNYKLLYVRKTVPYDIENKFMIMLGVILEKL